MQAWRNRLWGLVVGLLLGASPSRAALPAVAPDGSTSSFVAFSDIHFDPFFDPSLVADLVRTDPAHWRALFERSATKSVSAYGNDSNYPLLESALAAAAGAAPDPDFVLVTGDFLAHGLPDQFAKYSPHAGNAAYQRFARQTMEFVTVMIRDAFPRARVISALGNNDSDCGDYQLRPGGRFLARVASFWRPLLGPTTGAFEQTFTAGGFFSVPHPTVRHLRVVALNTVAFSPKYKSCGKGDDLAARQLAWLDRTLHEARRRGDKVWLLYHVPPGIDAFATLRATGPCPASPVPLWRTEDQSRFQRIVAKFPGLVKASFAGHTHMDELRLPAEGGFIHVTPAVSPLFGNNPGFAVFSYARATGEIADFRVYDLDLAAGGPAPRWAPEYDFREAYSQPKVDDSTLRAVQQRIGSDPEVRHRYMTFYPVSSSSATADLAHWQAYWCGAQTFTPEDFAACYCPSQTRQ
jgi:sphingomyelin phosphodiesterase acid-like 3